jgi:hypothetical protein
MGKPLPKTETIECVHCNERLGGNVLPVWAGDDQGEGNATQEPWCPQCFCSKRAPQDPRFADAVRIGQILPIACTACGKTTVDFGRHFCGQCGSKKFMVLLPKGAVISVDKLQKFVKQNPNFIRRFRSRPAQGAPGGGNRDRIPQRFGTGRPTGRIVGAS